LRSRPLELKPYHTQLLLRRRHEVPQNPLQHLPTPLLLPVHAVPQNIGRNQRQKLLTHHRRLQHRFQRPQLPQLIRRGRQTVLGKFIVRRPRSKRIQQQQWVIQKLIIQTISRRFGNTRISGWFGDTRVRRRVSGRLSSTRISSRVDCWFGDTWRYPIVFLTRISHELRLQRVRKRVQDNQFILRKQRHHGR
jgi:hypothetical protein